jgi:uncharacterized cupredoxin-like copper-binding protein
VVTGANGASATSDPAALIIGEPLTITSQPEDVSVQAGKVATFTVAASEEDVAYQWQYSADGGETWANSGYSSAKTDHLHFTAKAAFDEYLYRCVVNGSVVSESAALYIGAPIGIETQPEDVTVEAGKAALFTVEASGEDVTYQWQYSADGGETWVNSGYSSAKTATLRFTAKASFNGYLYRCVVNDSVNSDSAALHIATPTTITTQPTDCAVGAGKQASFTVEARGDDLSYQWQYRAPGGAWTNSGYSSAKTENGRAHV